MEGVMCKSLSLTMIVAVLLTSNTYVLRGMEPTAPQEERPAKYPNAKEVCLALYRNIVKQQEKKIPVGNGYENNIRAVLIESLESMKPDDGLIKTYHNMLEMEPTKFSALFSPHNIKMFAYQQNKFGNAVPYHFDKDKAKPLANQPNDPFLMDYYPENRLQPVLYVTVYSYFYGLLESIDTVLLSDNTVSNISTLDVNLREAKNNPLILSADAIGKIAHEVTLQGDMRFLDLINKIADFTYAFKDTQQNTPENIIQVVSKIKKIRTDQEIAKFTAPTPKLPTTTVQQGSVPLWKKALYATGAAGVATAIGAAYYKYFNKGTPSMSVKYR
jgi:hypothetical protein